MKKLKTYKTGHYLVEDAVAYGDSEAMMLYHIRYWVEHHKNNGTNCYNGRYWTYNSRKAFAKQFPQWNEMRVRRVIESLIKQEAILIGNFNKNKFDQTAWYTINDASSQDFSRVFNDPDAQVGEVEE